MNILDLTATGMFFVVFYHAFGLTELVSFTAVGTFFLAYLAWVVVCVLFFFLIGLISGKQILQAISKNNIISSNPESNNIYDDYVLAEEEYDEDDDIGIHISFE